MRRGICAVVEGVEYKASLHAGGVSIYVQGTPARPEGWEPGRRDSWGKALPLNAVSEAYEILTQAMLDDVAVYVDRVDPVAREAVVRAKNPPYPSMSDQYRPPPHPLLEAVPEPPYNVDWKGVIPWDRLTDVSETIGRIDPRTGVRIRDESA